MSCSDQNLFLLVYIVFMYAWAVSFYFRVMRPTRKYWDGDHPEFIGLDDV